MKKVLYILGDLSDSDIEWIAGVGKKVQFAKGNNLFQEGSEVPAFSIVLAGKCDVIIGGNEIGEIGQGDIIGEIALIDPRPASATIRASQETITLNIAIKTLREKLDRDDGFSLRLHRAIASFLANRLRNTNLYIAHGKGVNYDANLDDNNDLDELDESILESVSMAGNRFKQIIELINKKTK